MGRPWERLRALPVRIALLVGLALAVLLPAGLWLERILSDRLIESRVADLGAMLRREVEAGAGAVRLRQTRLARLARLLTGAANREDSRDLAEFGRVTHRAPDQTIRLARQTDATIEAVLWIPPAHPLDNFWKGFLVRGQTILSQVGSATVVDTTENVWFLTPNGAELMYSPSTPNYVDHATPEGYDLGRWLDPVRPENNPDGHPRLLPAQPSVSPPPLWFATLVAPVIRQGVLVGVAGVDFPIAGVIDQFSRLPSGSGRAYLIVTEDGLIAYGDGEEFSRAQTDSMRLRALPPPLGDSLMTLVERTRQAQPGAVSTSAVGSRIILAARLAYPDWTVIALIERTAVVAPLQVPLRLMRFGLVGVLSFLLVAILAAVATDIRRRRTIDEVKARASERFNRLFQMLPVTVILARTDTGEIVEANDAACRLVEQPRDRLVGRLTTDIGLASTAGQDHSVDRIMPGQGPVADHATKLVIAGQEIDVLMAARTVDVEGIAHTLTVIQDLRVQRQLEVQLIQAQKLEAVGRLAGGVAHDFNNLLTAVIGYGELLSASLDKSDERREDVGEILGAARRGAALTRQLLGFARQQSTAPRVVDMNGVIHGIERLLQTLIGETIRLTTDLGASGGTVLIDPGQLEQVVTNLAVNARDAMPGGGTLTLRTRDEGDQVVLEVTDTGSGIPDGIKAHIFEPFFTTKEVGKGTGLGLATCYGIVRQAGGTIHCESVVGRGTTFQVRLPRVGGSPERPSSQAEIGAPVMGDSRRILVVEDDDMVRAITSAILEDGGYQVVARDGPSAALAYLLESTDPVDLVISDIVMPRMSGPAFGRVLATTHASLPILFISGYNPEEATRSDLSALGHPFLAKPFSRDDLLRAVAEGLAVKRAEAPPTDPRMPLAAPATNSRRMPQRLTPR